MEIGEIFVKDINRSLNPVIKVNDLDDSALYQELDEYVVTKDIDKNFDKLYKGIIKGFGGGDKDHIGVWISGDFGSGKSHFLKISSFLLQNEEIHGKNAVEYFLNKPGLDPSVLRMMQDVGRRDIDTILFDIDSRSTRSQNEDSLVQVFMGVFNEKLGLCFDPSVAKLERYLIEENRFEDFKSNYQARSGKAWEQDRTMAALVKPKIADALVDCGAYSTRDEALEVATNISKESPVSVEEFADIVGRYCESKGPNYTLFFMADEVGQFISGNVQKMLKLQTITERIGVRCNGQVWIVVTSQEDVEVVVSGVSRNDFSKIQGRFTTKIKMTSSDVKEVVEKRVLLKKEDAAAELGAFYEANRADIHNRLYMKNQAEIRLYNDTKEFVNTYPFIPYQYPMLQEMLTSLRNKSASGKSLSLAARSMLRIFKDTAASNAGKDLSFVTPLYSFYDAIQPELDDPTNVVFHNAMDCTTLEEFDIDVLKTLFLVKYYEKLEKNLDNISALMISSFDQDRIDLKRKVQESLVRLTRENYVQTNADTYMFLTNEEQEISREIKNESIDPGMIYKDMSDFAFGNIFKLTSGKLNGRQFNRFIEDENINHTDHELSVSIFISDKVTEPYLPASSVDGILFKIPNGKEVENAFTDYLRTENYIRKKETVQQTANMRSILDGKRIELETMKGYAKSMLDTALRNARIFVNGVESSISDSLSADKRLSEASDILIDSVYSKHGYVRQSKTSSNIETFLKGRTTSTYDEIIVGMEHAFADLYDHLEDCKRQNRNITVKDVMDRFRRKPYGFETEDIQWMLSVLFRYGRIDLMFEGKTLKGMDCGFPDAKNCLLTTKNQDKVRIMLRQAVSQDQIIRAAEILSTVFSKTVFSKEENVVKGSNEYASDKKTEIISKLDIYRSQPRYPGKEILTEALEIMEKLSKLSSPELFTYVDQNEVVLRGLNDRLQTVYGFFNPDNPRRKLFDRGLQALDDSEKIITYLDEGTRNTLDEIRSIIESDDSKRLPTLNKLCTDVNDSIKAVTEQVKRTNIEQILRALEDNSPIFADHPELSGELKEECDLLIEKIDNCPSIADVQIAMGSLPIKINNLKQRIPKPTPQPSPSDPGDVPAPSIPKTPVRRKHSITSIYSERKSIESEEDIEKVIEGLRENMRRKLEEGPFDIVW